MKKLIPVLLAGSLLLSACNIPLAKSTPDANKISTSVAQTLTAYPTTASTQTPEIQVTTTSAPTATSTITPTATTSTDDPRNKLGSPSFSDTFTSGSSFGLKTTYEDDAVRIEATNGALLFTSLAAQHGKRWRLTYPMVTDLYLEGTFTTVSCSGFDSYGLVLRSPSYSDGIGYYFALSCNGQVSAMRWDSNGTKTILDWTAASSALSGSSQTNRLGIMVKGNEFKIYVNGTFVKSITDDTLNDRGHFGVYISAVEDPSFTFTLDEINEWDQ